jgi:hypothetical protein
MGSPTIHNDHGLLTWEPAIGRQIQGAPLALRRALQRASSDFRTLRASVRSDVVRRETHSDARYFSFSHSVTWTRYSSHSLRLSST